MHNQRNERDVAGEIAFPAWGIVTPVATVSTHTFGYKVIAFFRTSARPLQVEVVSGGQHHVVAIPDYHARVVSVLSMSFAIAVLVTTLLRRSR